MRETLTERLREHRPVRRTGGLVALATLGGDACVDAAPVVRAHLALDQPVTLQARDDARQRTLAEMHVLGQLLHAVIGRGEALQHLELADAEAVSLLEPAFERGGGTGVAILEVAPHVHELSGADGHCAASLYRAEAIFAITS